MAMAVGHPDSSGKVGPAMVTFKPSDKESVKC